MYILQVLQKQIFNPEKVKYNIFKLSIRFNKTTLNTYT